jgi:L-seryl-tRNA(Ser) seleniumtransferase
MNKPTENRNDNPYLRLGVRPFINCCSVRTIHGGSLMLPDVKAAMAAASKQFVNVPELMEAAGRRIADLCGAGFAIVTCGSAAAVALGTAGCVAGNDPEKMLRLPFTDGMANRVIMPKGQRFAYDQAIRMVGTKIVEVDSVADLTQALGEPVAMVCILGTNEETSNIRMEEIVKVVKPRGIPIMVDAASEHLERPNPWLARGADLVIYSGGKFLRGPQTSGILMGDEKLVRAAWANASPHQALGRPMKVSKEDIVGLVAAVEYWFNERDHAGERKKWNNDLKTISDKVAKVAGVKAEIIQPSGVERVPRLRVSWDKSKLAITGPEFREKMLEGDPRIMLDDMAATANSVIVDPFGLEAGEAGLIGGRFAQVLAAAPKSRPETKASTGRQVSGKWNVRIAFDHGEAEHRVVFVQKGAELSGTDRSKFFESPLQGTLSADNIEFGTLHRHEGSLLAYRFRGSVSDKGMEGTVVLGSGTDHHRGPVNMSQFGTARWTAERAEA